MKQAYGKISQTTGLLLPHPLTCVKSSLGTAPRPGILLGSSHLEPKEAQTPLVLLHKPTGTWFPYALCSPEGVLMVPPLSSS